MQKLILVSYLLFHEQLLTAQGFSKEKTKTYEKILGKLRCPNCIGLGIQESQTPFSIQMRRVVAAQVQGGKKEEEILDYFTQRYGNWILREPPQKGWHLILWCTPWLLLCTGILWLYWKLRKARKKNQGGGTCT